FQQSSSFWFNHSNYSPHQPPVFLWQSPKTYTIATSSIAKVIELRLNLTILDVVKKEVTKLLVVGIIYPIFDSQWVSLVQVVSKKSRTIVVKNRQDEMVSTRIQNSYMEIHIALVDQHKTTFTCPFGTFAYTRMPFGLCNAPSTFQRCMISIFLDFLEDYIEVFMDDFTVYVESFEACLDNLSWVLHIDMLSTNIGCEFEDSAFHNNHHGKTRDTSDSTVHHCENRNVSKKMNYNGCAYTSSNGDVAVELDAPRLGCLIGLLDCRVDQSKRESVFIGSFKITLPLSKLLQKDVDFVFDQPCEDAS
ncbi:hypothetical protein CR513_58889, partial [Mucuna pruriens]